MDFRAQKGSDQGATDAGDEPRRLDTEDQQTEEEPLAPDQPRRRAVRELGYMESAAALADVDDTEASQPRRTFRQRRVLAAVAAGLAVLVLLFWLTGRRGQEPLAQPEPQAPPTQSPAASPVVVAPPPLPGQVELPPASTGSMAFAALSEGQWQVFGVLPDGQDLRRLAGLAAGSSPGFVALSPDGLQVLYTSVAGGRSTTFIVDTSGQGQSRIFSEQMPGDLLQAAWSPDGRFIAAAVAVGGQSHLYRVSSDGTGWQRLADGPAAWPAWKHDSVEIAYVCQDGSSICRTTRLGDAPELLSAVGGPVLESLAWSPDGRTLIYVQDGQIYALDVREGARAAITRPGAEGWRFEHAVWSADGMRIITVRAGADDPPHLYMMAPTGERGERLLPDLMQGPARWPSWSGDLLK